MFKSGDWRNQDGVTLVELLASIVLITLILTTFITIFIQTAKTHKTSEHIVDATYIAQTEMEKVYSASARTPYANRESALLNLGYMKVSSTGDWIVFEKPVENGQLRIKLQKTPVKENMTHLVVQVVENPGQTLRAQMENILLWGAEL